MRKIILVVVALTLLFPLAIPALSPEPQSPEFRTEEPSPEFRTEEPSPDLLSYYWKLRIVNLGDLVSQLYPIWPPVAVFRYCDALVAHTTGRTEDAYSAEARDYIENQVLVPLAQSAGFMGRASDLQKLDLEAKRELTELFFSYCTNEIEFPYIENSKKLLWALALTPLGLGLVTPQIFGRSEGIDLRRFSDYNIIDLFPLIFAMKSPVEVAYYGASNCIGKSLLLASLLDLIGLDVGFGYIGAQLIYATLESWGYPVSDSTQYIPASAHTFVMLKDPGWGIGKWETGNEEAIKIVTGEDGEPIRGYLPSKDMMGTRMNGVYLLLDPTYPDGFNPVLSPVAGDPEFGPWLELTPEDLTFALLPAPENSPEVESSLPHLQELGSRISNRLGILSKILEPELDMDLQSYEKFAISAITLIILMTPTLIKIVITAMIGVLIGSGVGLSFFITGLHEGRIDLIGPLIGALIGGASWAFIFFVLMQTAAPMIFFLLFSDALSGAFSSSTSMDYGDTASKA